MRFREVLVNEGKEELPYLCFNDILTVWWVEPCNVSLMVSTWLECLFMFFQVGEVVLDYFSLVLLGMWP